MNQLKKEKSPYLLQHTNNPVHWHAWNEVAFEKAKNEAKPIFLSIGYSTCHWCHVMAHESFEDQEVANYLNTHFVSIKVDREERPDVDQLYMTACQMLTGQGGWPLTIVMTPDQRPFFAGTYLPKKSQFNRAGLTEVLENIINIWNQNPEAILKTTNQVMINLVQESIGHKQPATDILITKGIEELIKSYDKENGGFSDRPKFPSPHILLFLLKAASENNNTLNMVINTLIKMRLGGIYDHVGFGFHRYSTDSQWLVPHFEKMLYDQALLMVAYAEAYNQTKNELFNQTCKEISAYLMQNMQHKNGLFYAAEDADSEGEEGTFYVWSYDELADLVKDDLPFLEDTFLVTPSGNFFDEATGRPTGKNILNLKQPLNKAQQEKWLPIRKVLKQARQKRVKPHVDTKQLTDWNAMLVWAFTKTATLTDNLSLLESAKNLWRSLLTHIEVSPNQFNHCAYGDSSGIDGFSSDYAYMALASLALFEATCENEYLQKTESIIKSAITHFWDTKNEGFFMTSSTSEALIIKQKDRYDGASPSSNAVLYYVLIRLGQVANKKDYLDKATTVMNTLSTAIERLPSAYTFWLYGYYQILAPEPTHCKL